MIPYRAVLFDFDYTLGDGTDGIVESFHAAFDELGLVRPTVEEVRRTVGMSLEEAFAHLTGQTGRVELFLKSYRAKADEVLLAKTQLFPDAVLTLTHLREQGLKTGIVTNKYSFRLYEVLDKFNIRPLVDAVVGADMAGESKPSPKGLLLAAQQLKLDRGDILYVGDSTIDAQTAQAADIDFAGVTTGTTTAQDFSRYPCIAVADSLTALFSAIG